MFWILEGTWLILQKTTANIAIVKNKQISPKSLERSWKQGNPAVKFAHPKNRAQDSRPPTTDMTCRSPALQGLLFLFTDIGCSCRNQRGFYQLFVSGLGTRQGLSTCWVRPCLLSSALPAEFTFTCWVHPRSKDVVFFKLPVHPS